jgi:hypothetical protein
MYVIRRGLGKKINGKSRSNKTILSDYFSEAGGIRSYKLTNALI